MKNLTFTLEESELRTAVMKYVREYYKAIVDGNVVTFEFKVIAASGITAQNIEAHIKLTPQEKSSGDQF